MARKKRICNQGRMAHFDDADLEEANAALTAENARLKESLEAMRNKYDSCIEELKFLYREMKKMLEAKIVRLEAALKRNFPDLEDVLI